MELELIILQMKRNMRKAIINAALTSLNVSIDDTLLNKIAFGSFLCDSYKVKFANNNIFNNIKNECMDITFVTDDILEKVNASNLFNHEDGIFTLKDNIVETIQFFIKHV